MEEKSLSLSELHSEFLKMIIEFHNFCEGNGITYYMVGGTLLGAIRDGGFIPWDDDVDLAMPRPDYEKFLKLYSGSMVLKNYKNDKNFHFVYSKLFNTESPIVLLQDEEYKIDSKIFLKLDIYPIDGLGNSEKKAKKLIARVARLKSLLYILLTNEKSKNQLKNLLKYILRIIPASYLISKTDKIMCSHNFETSTLVTRWNKLGFDGNVFDKCYFSVPKKVKFETLELYAPTEAEKYLKCIYGDYSVPVRENEGARHSVDFNGIVENLVEIIQKGSE